MNRRRLKFLVVGASVVVLAVSCNSIETNDVRDSSEVVRTEELQKIISSMDSIVQETTEESNIDSAYKVFLMNYDDLCVSTSLIPDVFNLFIKLQDANLFFEIWRLDWIMDIESGHREIWLLLNHTKGLFWKIFSENASKLSGPIFESYKMTIERDAWHGFFTLCRDFDTIQNYNELERAYIALIIITKTINSN